MALAWLAAGPGAQPQQPLDLRATYTKTEHLVPMCDGVRLFTIVFAPRDQSQPYPIMLHRTPYGSLPYDPDSYRASLGPSPAFAKEGFTFAYQDVRGEFRSEGEFVAMRPIRPDPRGPTETDESTDTYTTRSAGSSSTCPTTTDASANGASRTRARIGSGEG